MLDLKPLLKAVHLPNGMADPCSEQHRDWVRRNNASDGNKKRGIRYNAAESPVSALARRKNKDGTPFLAPELVAAASTGNTGKINVLRAQLGDASLRQGLGEEGFNALQSLVEETIKGH